MNYELKIYELRKKILISIYSKVILTILLFCFAGICFGQTTQSPVFSKKETLYSTKNGNAIGNLLLSIEQKGANEWILTIGDRGNFFESRTERTLWIFNRRVDANTFRRDMRNRDYPVEVRDLTEFVPFCENGIRFEIKDWEELNKQTQVSFFINASPGQIVTLRLVFYTASQDSRRRTTIDDEARVRIEFEIPDPVVVAQQQRAAAQEAELLSLAENIDYEAIAKQREAQREDSLLRAEAANRGERIALINTFISERNREINSLQEEVNILLADKKTKVSDLTIDSLATIAVEMKNRVDYWENGYSDILLTEEAIHNQFSKFRIAHSLTAKKIDELRQQQNPLNSILDFIKNNLLLSLGAGIVGLILLKLLMKLLKKIQSAIKSKISQKISKMKSDAKNKVKDSPKKWGKKKKKQPDDEFENIDINDLAEI